MATIALLAATVGCGDDDDDTGGAGGAGAAGAAGSAGVSGGSGQSGSAGGVLAATVARFGPGVAAVFPSDAYLVDDPSAPGKRRVSLADLAPVEPVVAAFPQMRAQLELSDGFSPVGGVFWSFSGAIDPALAATGATAFVEPGASLAMVDVDPASPEKGQRFPIVVRSYAATLANEDPRDDFTVLAQPGRPLRPGTRYAFAVTTRVKDAAGLAVGPSQATSELLASGGGAYGDEVRAALPTLAAAGVPASEVALISVFTTSSATDEIFAMAKAARQTAPTLDGKVEVVTVSETDDRVLVRGRYLAPEFRRTATDGLWTIANGAPVAQAQVSLEFDLSFTKRSGKSARPVVLFAHGVGASKDAAWGVTQLLSSIDVATIAIDAPEHGTRHQGTLDPLFDFFSIDLGKGTVDLAKIRDNFRQMTSDQLRLVQLITGPLSTLDVLPVGAPDGVPDLDTTRIGYLGQSLGSIMAPTALAVAPEISAGCLDVGGAGLTAVVRESVAFSVLVDLLRPATFTDGDMVRFFAMGQGVFDPGDSLNFAPFVNGAAGPGVSGWKPRHLLLQEVPDDKTVPNIASELLGRTLAMTQVAPVVRPIAGLPTLPAPMSNNLAGAYTVGYSQLPTIEGKASAHGTLLFSPEASSQYATFLGGALLGAGPVTVIDPYAAK